MMNLLRTGLAIATIAAIGLLPLAAQGDPTATGPPCGFHAQMTDYLRTVYGEIPIGRGLRGDGMVLEVMAAPVGSWTIIVTGPNSVSCLVSAGESWEMFPLGPSSGSGHRLTAAVGADPE
ncbi:MAG: hypothetical protein HYR63_26615 [Proteobacteria bacterium]|nr:hypothetical protein [Pseudomonadota bacterium]MBI3495972.1 hypothetical protein [Pseudomonadota bacterium]